ncbi:hypothetical protein DFH08DRAFT_140975 [Mycena albidolilacea]|uniref:Uncharacterized protein n=1 Tax=Mycena albidolilacea TaxID=1033008 RepID=A0AAD7A4E3_9AGAR|nr:hypothetical protein DFH08DRAFT_140975 [Mycena albidolilacea]
MVSKERLNVLSFFFWSLPLPVICTTSSWTFLSLCLGDTECLSKSLMVLHISDLIPSSPYDCRLSTERHCVRDCQQASNEEAWSLMPAEVRRSFGSADSSSS